MASSAERRSCSSGTVTSSVSASSWSRQLPTRGQLGGTGRAVTRWGVIGVAAAKGRRARDEDGHGREHPLSHVSPSVHLPKASRPTVVDTFAPKLPNSPCLTHAEPRGVGAKVTSTITRRWAIRETSGRLWISQPTHVAVVDISALQRRLPRVHTDWGDGPPSVTGAQARSGTARVGADHFPSGTTAAVRSPRLARDEILPHTTRERDADARHPFVASLSMSLGHNWDTKGSRKATTPQHPSTMFPQVSAIYRLSPTPPNHAGRVRDVLRHLSKPAGQRPRSSF